MKEFGISEFYLLKCLNVFLILNLCKKLNKLLSLKLNLFTRTVRTRSASVGGTVYSTTRKRNKWSWEMNSTSIFWHWMSFHQNWNISRKRCLKTFKQIKKFQHRLMWYEWRWIDSNNHTHIHTNKQRIWKLQDHDKVMQKLFLWRKLEEDYIIGDRMTENK